VEKPRARQVQRLSPNGWEPRRYLRHSLHPPGEANRGLESICLFNSSPTRRYTGPSACPPWFLREKDHFSSDTRPRALLSLRSSIL
jgi:hypothetical protein